MTHCLYRHFGQGDELLYVGVSGNVRARTSQHSTTASWWGDVSKITIERFTSRDEALRAETRAIRAEAPIHNRSGVAKNQMACPVVDGRSVWDDADILADVEAYLARTGMSAQAFGAKALNDTGFLTTLRRGREVRRKTRQKVLAFMQNNQPVPSGGDETRSEGLSNPAR